MDRIPTIINAIHELVLIGIIVAYGAGAIWLGVLIAAWVATA